MEKLKIKFVEFASPICGTIRAAFEKKPTRFWTVVVVLTGLSIFFIDQGGAKTEVPPETQEQPEAVDTFIPAGFVLVPIEVINYESLDSVLGRFGVVDLFAADPRAGGQSKQVASRIKILRAPRNPSQFAVLAPETESAQLVKHIGGFYVVIQNPAAGGTSFENTATKMKRRSRLNVEYNDE